MLSLMLLITSKRLLERFENMEEEIISLEVVLESVVKFGIKWTITDISQQLVKYVSENKLDEKRIMFKNVKFGKKIVKVTYTFEEM